MRQESCSYYQSFSEGHAIASEHILTEQLKFLFFLVCSCAFKGFWIYVSWHASLDTASYVES